MHLAVNGWFWGQLNTGSGQYLHQLVQHLPGVQPAQGYTLVLPQTGPPEHRAGAATVGKSQERISTPSDGGQPAGEAQAIPLHPQSLPGEAEGEAHADLQAPPDTWSVQRVTVPAGFGRNMAKAWFEQVAFPLACRNLGADMALVPYWASPWWRPCPVAVTVHDLIPLLLPAYRGGALQRLYTRLVAGTARRADLVITDSRASRQDITQHLQIPKERVHAILLAAGESYRRVTDEADLQRVRHKYKLPPRLTPTPLPLSIESRANPPSDPINQLTNQLTNQPFFLYLGGFDVRKNVTQLVKAYALFLRNNDRLPNSPHLIIAGRLPASDTPFTPDPKRVVSGEGLQAWVHFTGWVDEADKPALYSLATAFVFPSLYEGFGLPVAEAAACGTPVVTSNRSSLPEAAPGAILVDPEDLQSLAWGLKQATQQGPELAEGSFRTWADVARETHETLACLA